MTVAPCSASAVEGGSGAQRSSHSSTPSVREGICSQQNSSRLPNGTR